MCAYAIFTFRFIRSSYVEQEKSIHRQILKCKNNIHHQYLAGFGVIGDDHTDSLYGKWFIEIFEGKYEF